MKKVAVFLDRDGTINLDTSYISSAADFVFLPNAKEGLKLLQESGFLLFIVTNQSGLARGYFTLEDLEEIHAKLIKEVGEIGVKFEGIFFCPHHPDENCDCRKPSPAGVLKFAREYDIDLGKSYFIGDKVIDVETGAKAGCRTVLLATPEGAAALKNEDGWREPDYILPDLHAAADLIAGLKKDEER